MDKFWPAFWLAFSGWLIPILLFALSVGAYIYLSHQDRQKLKYVQAALTLASKLLGERLGDKANFVIEAWLAGLTAIQDGKFTLDEGIDQFVRFIAIAAKTHGIELTPSDMEAIEEAIAVTLGMVDIQSKPAKQAVVMMLSDMQN